VVKRNLICMVAAFLFSAASCHANPAVSPFITAQRLSAIYKSSSAVVADIRPDVDFAQRHVPGSINIPAFALAKKRMFFKKDVVIVGYCLAACRMLDLRNRMLANGFGRVKILAGGIDAWGGGADIVPKGVKPFLLRAALGCKGLSPLVIDLRPSAAYARRHIRGSVSVPFAGDKKRFLARLKRIKPFFGGAGQNPSEPVVLVSGAEALSVEAAALLKQKNRPFLFYLSGGTTAWFLKKDYPEAKVTVGPGTNGCASCPESP